MTANTVNVGAMMGCQIQMTTTQHDTTADVLARLARTPGVSLRVEQLGNGTVRHILVYDQPAPADAADDPHNVDC